MKQALTIRVHDADVAVKIVAHISADGRTVARDEQQRIRYALAAAIMKALPDLPYTAFHLANIKVR